MMKQGHVRIYQSYEGIELLNNWLSNVGLKATYIHSYTVETYQNRQTVDTSANLYSDFMSLVNISETCS